MWLSTRQLAESDEASSQTRVTWPAAPSVASSTETYSCWIFLSGIFLYVIRKDARLYHEEAQLFMSEPTSRSIGWFSWIVILLTAAVCAAPLGSLCLGGDFRPKCTLDVAQVQALLKPPSTMQRLGAKATADSCEMGYEPECAIDGNPQTMWHTACTPSKAPLPHGLVIVLRQTAEIAGIRVLPCQDNNPNGQIARYAVHTSVDKEHWELPVAEGLSRHVHPKPIRPVPTLW